MTYKTLSSTVAVFVLILGLAAAASAVQPGLSVQLDWNSSPDPAVTGYLVYYGNASGAYSTRLDAGSNSNFLVSGLQTGLTYYFVVTAYDATGEESLFSNEARFSLGTNSAPALTLAAIANQSVSPGQQLTITNSAKDSNAGAILFYSLGAGTPAGLSVNSSSGVISWIPSAAEAGATNQITVWVSDNSAPVLTNAQTFTVVVGNILPAGQIAFMNSAALPASGIQQFGGQQNGAFGLGLEFTVNSPIVISQLGAFDATIGASGLGFGSPVQVGIFSEATQFFVSPSVTFSGTAGTVTGSYRFQSISNLVLNPGIYLVIATSYGISTAPDWNAAVAGLSQSLVQFNNGGGILTAGRNFYGNNDYALAPVNSLDAGPYPQYAAGTFAYSAVATTPVPMRLSAGTVSGNNFSFSFPTALGQNYVIQQNADLTTTNWSVVTNLAGTGSPIHFNIPVNNAVRQMYFRVMQPGG